MWYVNGQGRTLQIWGQAGDIPVPATTTATASTDIAVWSVRAASGTSRTGPSLQIWGQAGRHPGPG